MSRENLFVTLDDIPLSGKRVLVRVDFNVPIRNNRISDDARIRASLPTIKQILDEGGKLVLMSHMGRPQEGQFDQNCSLAPVADHLAGLLGQKVTLV
ncbi:MAG: phosphoglycerate kinase, partial [Gammaproteobacteria bacterium]